MRSTFNFKISQIQISYHADYPIIYNNNNNDNNDNTSVLQTEYKSTIK